MSPVAAAMAALLHALVALAFLWELPRHEAEAAERAIEFTVEDPTPPPATPEAAQPAPAPQAAAPQAAAQVPSPPPASPPPNPAPRLGLAPPRSLTPDPRAQPAPPQPGPTPAEKPVQATEPAKPAPEQQQAAAAPPPPPPEPKLEQALPPVEAPPPPLTAQDFPKAAPPPPPKTPPPPPQRAQAPPPQRQQLQPSPLSTAPQQRAPADSQAAARPSPLTNPASQYGQRKVEDDYLWQVSRILSQHQQFVRNVTTEQGSVVLRMTVARDGRLVDVGLFQSSGIAALDATAVNLIRQAGPYPRLPPEIAGAQHSFILPLHFRRSN